MRKTTLPGFRANLRCPQLVRVIYYKGRAGWESGYDGELHCVMSRKRAMGGFGHQNVALL